MSKVITGVVLLVVGFVGGLLFTGADISEENHAKHADDSHAMKHEKLVDVPEGFVAPTVQLEVLEDPKSGWNARITTTGFRFAPEHASTEHVFGEGHAHIYVDDVKINRVYGDWYYLGSLEEGTHNVRVELSANDHSSYAVDGVKIEDSVQVVVAPKAAFDSANAVMLNVAVSERALSPQTVTVTQGDSVHLMVATDEMGEFHVAGYEIEKTMDVNGKTDVMFIADKAGRYAIELHPQMEGHMMEDNHDSMHMESGGSDIEIGALIVNPR